MAKCACCNAETELYASGVPICIQCSYAAAAKCKPSFPKQAIEALLVNGVAEAMAQVRAASQAFDAAIREIPSGLPQPDGAQRIYNASCELAAARKEMMKAHTRLNDFIERGIVPENLQRRG